MAKVRREIASLLRVGLGIFGNGIEVTRQVRAAMGEDEPEVLKELASVCGVADHVATTLEGWSDRDEDAFVGKVVKVTSVAVVQGAQREMKRRKKKTRAKASRRTGE